MHLRLRHLIFVIIPLFIFSEHLKLWNCFILSIHRHVHPLHLLLLCAWVYGMWLILLEIYRLSQISSWLLHLIIDLQLLTILISHLLCISLIIPRRLLVGKL